MVKRCYYFRCIIDKGCTAYKFKAEGRKCALIDESSMQTTFLYSSDIYLYTIGRYSMHNFQCYGTLLLSLY